ncbi:MAG: carboxypeptidase regulatory-like domain-containing protein [Planctomycetota bacterium]
MLRIALCLALSCFVIACGGSEEPKKTAPAPAADDGGSEEESFGRQTYSADKGSATVSGTVKWSGKAPNRRPLDMGSDKFCEKCYEGQEAPRSMSAVVGANGEFANIFVYVKNSGDMKNWKFPKGSSTRVIDQVKCMYTPYLIGVQTGDTLEIRNSDQTLHNIHATKDGNDWFNKAQPAGSDAYTTTVTEAGMFTLKCDVHSWMKSFICVVDNPFFAVTGEDGKFSIPSLPAGSYTLVAWDSRKGKEMTKDFTVSDGGSATVDFEFSK